MPRPIDIMIIGVEKAGTTSLLRYLGEHPSIATHQAMEFPYFVKDELYTKGYDALHAEYFTASSNESFLLAKSVGCIYWPTGPERLKLHNRNMKLIVMLRHPVDRAHSAYWFAVQKGREHLKTFEEAIDQEHSRLTGGHDYHNRYHAYLKRGLYAAQLSALLEVFPEKQVKVVILEEFKKSPDVVIKDIFAFMGLPSVIVNTGRRHNETSGESNKMFTGFMHGDKILRGIIRSIIPRPLAHKIKLLLSKRETKQKTPIPEMNMQTRNQLQKYYECDIKELEKLLGRKMEIWHNPKK
jgi:hypothetical protein